MRRHYATIRNRFSAGYSIPMANLVAVALALVWMAANLYLWSLKQDPEHLFWQSLGMAGIAFPALFWFVSRTRN